MRAGIIGGGINGICTAWAFALAGHGVTLFERDKLMRATSAASTKLLHGGLRYLEHGEFRLVREALRERHWWLLNAPALCSPIEICLPVYAHGRRSRWRFKCGLWFYDLLAGSRRLRRHCWRVASEMSALHPGLRKDGLHGAYYFSDGQMYDYELGLWAAERAREAGAELREQAPVSRIGVDGWVTLASGGAERFDHVINATGPWAAELLRISGIESSVRIDLVKGSHLLLGCQAPGAFLLEHPEDARVFFVLPYKEQTLVGTTEVRQSAPSPAGCTEEEKNYLLTGYNHYFKDARAVSDITATFSGVRPLLRTSDDPTSASREYVIETRGRLTTVFGGKWTTARALARKTVTAVNDAWQR